MTEDTIVKIAFGQLLIIAGLIWRGSAVITELKEAIRHEREARELLSSALEKVQVALAALNAVPMHELRIKTLEDAVAGLAHRLDSVWRKVFSLDKHVAVVRAHSGHDIESADTDPPPRGD